MKKTIIALVLICFVASGCTGSFNLTKKLYNWHHSNTDKWSDEFGFLVCALLPIYGISTFADAIVFNSIEFWTGKNPVEARAQTDTKYVKAGNEEATLSYNRAANEITIASEKKGFHPAVITLAKNGDTMTTKDKDGNVLYTTTKDGNGGFLVYNKDSKLIRSFSADQLNAAAGKMN